jgi:hypothetical protein
MRLADFIEQNAESILSAAEKFTAGLMPAAAHLDSAAMRDHLPMMLEAVVIDLRTHQTPAQEMNKSLGLQGVADGQPDTAAQAHAILRAKSGFNVEQLVAEYRALRASVLRLWLADDPMVDVEMFRDSTRFNEAIDQAMAESVASFSAEADRWRHVFLAVLGHDLRGPLNAVLLTAELLSRMGSEVPTTAYTQSLIRSGRRMQQLLDSLLDYSRTSLGRGIGIHRGWVSMANECGEELDVLRASLPGRRIDFVTQGMTEGSYDASRIREIVSNLVYNAAKYSAAESVIRVDLKGGERGLSLKVENAGATIAQGDLQALFEPLRRGKAEFSDGAEDRSNLGLGLFIVQEIAKAHGGDVQAASNDGKTTFTVTLPARD